MRPLLASLALATLLAAALALPLDAQKSTIQSSRGGGGGGSMVRGGGGGSGAIARGGGGGGSSRGGISRPSRPAGGAVLRGGSTLSPGFPRKGRGEGPHVTRSVPRSSGGVERHAARPSGDGDGKRFLSGASRGGTRWDDDEWHGSDRKRHVHHGNVVVVNPYWYDPFLRYRYFDGWRYSLGFGCGFYDRYWWGVGGWGVYPYGGHDPCFSSFSLHFGYPWFSDPWPGFWSWGWYGGGPGYGGGGGYGGGYGGPDAGSSSYDEGYEDGYERGYGEGRDATAPQVDYGTDLSPDAGPGPGPDAGLPLHPDVRRHLAAGEYEAALAELDRLLDDYPSDPAAHFARGITLTALRHYGKAAEALRDGLDAGGPARLAIDAPALFPSRAEFRRTVGELEAYVQNRADSRDARFALGALYLFSGEIDAGRALLRGLGDDAHAHALLERTGLSG